MKLSDLVPVGELQSLCESFTAFTGAVTAVLDLEGNILVATGWQQICTAFHRKHPGTAARCRESDTALAGALTSGQGHNIYKCRNGLVDVAVPIVIGGEHCGNFFTGQFFLEKPDREQFLRQADQFGFERRSYLDALDRTPVFTEQEVLAMVEFFSRLARLIGDMGLANARERKANQELRESRHLLQTVIDTVPMRIFWKDRLLRFLGCNPAFAQDAGKTRPDEMVGLDDFQMIWAEQAEMYREDDRRVIESGNPKLGYDEPITMPGGVTAWVRTSKVPLRNQDDEIIGLLGIYEDVTERKAAESRIRELAYYDPLTGLPNRRLLKDRLSQALAACARTQREGALLFIDLDDFKSVNDTYGHERGDLLLQDVAARLTLGIREVDTVARIGGDEFVVVLSDLNNTAEEAATKAKLVGEKILGIIARPYSIAGNSVSCTASIGIGIFDKQHPEISELMRQADIAMYQAKSAGRNTLRFFDPDLQEAIRARAAFEADLRNGLRQKQFLLHYQPQVGDCGGITGVEALARWLHPRRGMVSPGEFIPLAEETGLILPLGEWVLETACAQLAEWADRPQLAHLTIAVNVSARQFHQGDFVERVQAILHKTGANPRRLKLELTESLLVMNVEDVIEKMRVLKAAGTGFSLDDFGTGYSSLAYLKRLPLEQLKIDQSFVRDILTDQNDAAIARTIIALAKSLGLGVIAEGVETVEQRDFLARAGCSAYQGYLFARPLPVAAFERFVHQA